MNYYERHLGDYAKDTAHLSMLEHGAYSLLLDRYYGTESGIPKDQAHRLARARSKEEKQAVDAVLDEFFTLKDGVYINQRAEDEITKAQSKIKAAQENGRRGGRPKINREVTETKPSGLFPGYENETKEKAHQTPDTKHQAPVSNTTNTNTVNSMSLAASVCVEYRNLGMIHANPQHPDLLELIAGGSELQEFVSAGSLAMDAGKGFAYALGIVKNRKQEKLIENSRGQNEISGTTRQTSTKKLSLVERAERDCQLAEQLERDGQVQGEIIVN
ncbi:MAG: YdaU family protein [Methylobacter sp.]